MAIAPDNAESLDAKSSDHSQFDRALKQNLERAGGQDIRFADPILYYGEETQLFLSNPNIQAMYETLKEIEQAPLKDIAEFLRGVIEQRARQDDLWPDGRLHLGIVYAALEDFEAARNTLEEVIEICESGGRYMQKNIAMAA
jgi:tetratricopeptide (TPR) repeat protein